jgi:hypothetical protein
LDLLVSNSIGAVIMAINRKAMTEEDRRVGNGGVGREESCCVGISSASISFNRKDIASIESSTVMESDGAVLMEEGR